MTLLHCGVQAGYAGSWQGFCCDFPIATITIFYEVVIASCAIISYQFNINNSKCWRSFAKTISYPCHTTSFLLAEFEMIYEKLA